MENLRLNCTDLSGGLLSVGLAWVPDLAQLSSAADVALKLASLASVTLIIILNLKKLRSNAPA